jgi:hypothetical protein
MARRRFIQMREPPYEFIEVAEDFSPGPRTNTDAALWNDRGYDGLKATDGTDISSRTKHREYMRANGLTTVDDFKGTWKEAERKRDAYRTGKTGSVTKQDIAEAIASLESRK